MIVNGYVFTQQLGQLGCSNLYFDKLMPTRGTWPLYFSVGSNPEELDIIENPQGIMANAFSPHRSYTKYRDLTSAPASGLPEKHMIQQHDEFLDICCKDPMITRRVSSENSTHPVQTMQNSNPPVHRYRKVPNSTMPLVGGWMGLEDYSTR